MFVRFGFAQASQQDFWTIVAVTVAVPPMATSFKRSQERFERLEMQVHDKATIAVVTGDCKFRTRCLTTSVG